MFESLVFSLLSEYKIFSNKHFSYIFANFLRGKKVIYMIKSLKFKRSICLQRTQINLNKGIQKFPTINKVSSTINKVSYKQVITLKSFRHLSCNPENIFLKF